MAQMWLQIVTLGCLFCLSLAQDVYQTPHLILPIPGEDIPLKCIHKDRAYPMKFWYRQGKAGEPMVLIGYNYREDITIESDFVGEKFKIVRTTELESILTVSKVSVQDNGIYYCAISTSGGNTAAHFGAGTILSVLGENEKQVQPKVKIYLPNKKEFQEHELISLVCVASGFFPEHVRITWYINDEKIESLYQNVPKKEKDGKFSTSSRLSVTKSQYFNPDNKFRCEAAFVGEKNAASDEIQGELGCGISKESYGRYMNQGKISYIMVLFKSGLYAVIVLAVIWRRKVLLGSC